MFTDGLVEGRDANREQLGVERIVEVLEAKRDEPSLERVADAVLAIARQHCEDGLADDVTLVLIRLDAAPAESEGPPVADLRTPAAEPVPIP
jgi:serine phosphatase RsbU (regulator of sigma subunit)